MTIPLSQLQVWSTQPDPSRSAETYASVRAALEGSVHLRPHSFEIYLQGSYANATNIRADSDVDVVAQLTSSFLWSSLASGARRAARTARMCASLASGGRRAQNSAGSAHAKRSKPALGRTGSDPPGLGQPGTAPPARDPPQSGRLHVQCSPEQVIRCAVHVAGQDQAADIAGGGSHHVGVRPRARRTGRCGQGTMCSGDRRGASFLAAVLAGSAATGDGGPPTARRSAACCG
jgi:hypothetical protein